MQPASHHCHSCVCVLSMLRTLRRQRCMLVPLLGRGDTGPAVQRHRLVRRRMRRQQQRLRSCMCTWGSPGICAMSLLRTSRRQL